MNTEDPTAALPAADPALGTVHKDAARALFKLEVMIPGVKTTLSRKTVLSELILCSSTILKTDLQQKQQTQL
jgi:hypothetical protein